MTFAAIISSLTFLFSILTKVVGFPAQSKLIIKSKSVAGISLTLYLITFISYVLWTIHGYMVNDFTLIWGQGLGVVTSGFILGQIFYYRKRA